jgi:hypothetical protein
MIRSVPATTLRPVELTCDRCGRVILESDYTEWPEALQLRFTGGYGSVFGDGARVEVDLCQHCVRELLGPFCRVNAANA